MSAQLPRPSASPGAAPGRTVIRGKIAMATQRQRERAFLLANVDKYRGETVCDKSRDMISRAALVAAVVLSPPPPPAVAVDVAVAVAVAVAIISDAALAFS